ncbi:MAG: aminotransferase class I/II-fold pyridoxal phosphate-dependent enzyme, partial [Chloroflexi bacterium]|nr:aminotransferase class I/II-fold pyridoxal phosphate-dependent enzyme [Chloroflexota bacterium]
TRLFLLCSPHNPVGRVFRRDELERLAEICLRHNLWIVSDDIHCDLLFQGRRHIPIASLAPEVAKRTITVMAPSKTYNIAGLKCSIAVAPDAETVERMQAARSGLVPGVNLMGYVAALAAYRDCQPWLDRLLAYLEGNRDFLLDYVRQNMPQVAVGTPEGTYLGWLDCRALDLGESPKEFFLREARVALNEGAEFGPGGEGFVRLNFGCPRSVLETGLERMGEALARRR